jgi:hypothetical protein
MNNRKDTLFTKLQINDKKKNKKKDPTINYIKKYETFNIVSETGDSIYSPLLKESPIEEKGQISTFDPFLYSYQYYSLLDISQVSLRSYNTK